MKDFVVCGEDEGFLVKMKDFLFFFVFAKNPLSSPQCLSMFTLHTSEGGAYTEHVQTY